MFAISLAKTAVRSRFGASVVGRVTTSTSTSSGLEAQTLNYCGVTTPKLAATSDGEVDLYEHNDTHTTTTTNNSNNRNSTDHHQNDKDDRIRRIQEMARAGFGDMHQYLYEQGLEHEHEHCHNDNHRPLGRAVDSSILRDTFGRQHTYLRVSLTERCNLRCTYCMPEEGVSLSPAGHLMTTPELERVARLFVTAGINKIRLTGGEPTLRKDLVDIVGMLSAMPGMDQVAMTTNGIVLHRTLPQLKRAGLTHLNISLDTLKEDRFERMTRRKGLRRVLGAIDLALEQDFEKVKVNVVVMKGQNEDEVLDFVEMTRNKPVNVRFIEWMPFDGNVWSHHKMEPYAVTKKKIEDHFGPLERTNAWEKSAVAKDFRVKGFQGEVAFITSMTDHFCGTCNRLRLMADGNFKVCLFGQEETNLLEGLRAGLTDEEIAGAIHHAVQRKRAKHAGMFELSKMPNRAMVKIGG